MSFRLRYLQHNLELTPGEFLIGRSAECQLSLDDPLVSRKHAMLAVSADDVTVRDLGSRNGVLINGKRIQGAANVADGDKITIGSQEMTLLRRVVAFEDEAQARRRLATQTLTSVVAPVGAGGSPARDVAKRADAFRLLAGLGDKALALGKAEEAERIVVSFMTDMLAAVERAPSEMPTETVEQVTRYAVKLAGATGKGSWADYAVRVYAALARPMPAAVVDELYAVMRKVGPMDLTKLRAYVASLREAAPRLGPAERFLVQRVEGLERLAALR